MSPDSPGSGGSGGSGTRLSRDWLAGAFAAWKKLDGLQPQPIDLGRIALLREAGREVLTDAAALARLLAELGLNDEGVEEFPAWLHPRCGQGLRIWQYPDQLAPYLCDLAHERITSYLEIGVRHGGTFVATVEYLERFHPLARAVGVDVIPCPSFGEYQRLNPRAELWQVNTRSPEFARRLAEQGTFDLVLIDSLHEEEHCRAEFLAVRQHAGIIAFHDIASQRYPGVAAVWNEVAALGEHRCREYTAQYAGVPGRFMGIGVAVRKDRGSPDRGGWQGPSGARGASAP